jgi:hypothetical protein
VSLISFSVVFGLSHARNWPSFSSKMAGLIPARREEVEALSSGGQVQKLKSVC